MLKLSGDLRISTSPESAVLNGWFIFVKLSIINKLQPTNIHEFFSRSLFTYIINMWLIPGRYRGSYIIEI